MKFEFENNKQEAKLVDFHIHTLFSDGTYTPEEIAETAFKNGIKAFAITDHDSVDGIERGRAAALKEGIEFISGIEFSTDFLGKEIHILGYFLNEKDPELLNTLEMLRIEREERTIKIIKKLNELKIGITEEDVKKEVTRDLISRNHIASALLKKGFVKPRGEAFYRYLGSSGAAYIPKTSFPPEKAVEAIKKNGGVAVLAHPKLIPLGQGKFNELLELLGSYGLDGIETYYPGHEIKDINIYKRIAFERGMIVTGGSDFHGLNRDDIAIRGANVPMEVYESLKLRKK